MVNALAGPDNTPPGIRLPQQQKKLDMGETAADQADRREAFTSLPLPVVRAPPALTQK